MNSAVKIADGKKMVYIIMGVSGCGKTTIGRMLAKRLAIKFYDADDFHAQNNINKMKNLISLDDDDRNPWLLDIAMHIAQWNRDEGAVLACSALKEKYRQILSGDGKEKVAFIYLESNKNIILERMKGRKEHFFPLGLLESQFNALEAPLNAIKVRIDKTPEDICKEIIDKLIVGGLIH
ncbi:MAG TPA: gluconokinase [Candidatus Wujingus californicus]|uniref:gluconokinase n=1 Tax=Candidatus Wunengus californicus TaxID=3367619 RepID=UPI0040291319